MSVEYRSLWMRAPEPEDKTRLVRALERFGTSYAASEDEVLSSIVLTSRIQSLGSGPDVTLYADTDGVLLSFHFATRAQRDSIVSEVESILVERNLGTRLEEE